MKKRTSSFWLFIAVVMTFLPIIVALTAWGIHMHFGIDDALPKKLTHYSTLWMIWSGTMILINVAVRRR